MQFIYELILANTNDLFLFFITMFFAITGYFLVQFIQKQGKLEKAVNDSLRQNSKEHQEVINRLDNLTDQIEKVDHHIEKIDKRIDTQGERIARIEGSLQKI